MQRSLLFLVLVGCGGGSSVTEPPPPVTPGRAAAMAVTAGAGQRAEVGKELAQAIVVHVTDAQALAVPNQLVNFVVVSGGGKVFAGSAQTTALGEARERWTLGTAAGEQVMEARAVDQATGDPIVFAKVTATADPGPPAKLTLTETEHTMFLGEQLDLAGLAAAADQYDNVIAGPSLTVVAVAPFTVQGTRVSSASEIAASVAISSGVATANIKVTVLRNLKELTGSKGSYTCTGQQIRPGSLGDTDPRGVITHYSSAFVVDSAVYPGAFTGVATIWITNAITLTFQDSSVEPREPFRQAMEVGVQLPGYLNLGQFGTARVTGEAPLTYQGGANCPEWYRVTGFDPFTITGK